MVAAAAVPTMPPPEITTSADVVDAERCCTVVILQQDNLPSIFSPAITNSTLVWARRHRLGLATQPNIRLCDRNIFKLKRPAKHLSCLLYKFRQEAAAMMG